MSVHPAKTQISLGIHQVWSESSLSAQWVPKDPSFLHVDSEYSDQTGQMPRLTWVFAVRTLILLVLSCSGSNSDVRYWEISSVVAVCSSVLTRAKAGRGHKLIHYPTYDIHPSNTLAGKNLSIKYRLLTHTYFMRSIFVSYWFIIPSTTLLHQIVFKILSLITGLWKIGHWSTYISWSQSLCHTCIISNMMFIYQIILKILSKITGPWNIGQWPTNILWSKFLFHTDPVSQVWPSYIR